MLPRTAYGFTDNQAFGNVPWWCVLNAPTANSSSPRWATIASSPSTCPRIIFPSVKVVDRKSGFQIGFGSVFHICPQARLTCGHETRLSPAEPTEPSRRRLPWSPSDQQLLARTRYGLRVFHPGFSSAGGSPGDRLKSSRHLGRQRQQTASRAG